MGHQYAGCVQDVSCSPEGQIGEGPAKICPVAWFQQLIFASSYMLRYDLVKFSSQPATTGSKNEPEFSSQQYRSPQIQFGSILLLSASMKMSSPISCLVIQGSTGRLVFGLDPHMNVLADKHGDMTFVYLIILESTCQRDVHQINCMFGWSPNHGDITGVLKDT